MKKNSHRLWRVLKNTINGFLDKKILKLSAALAYTTVFSIGPLLLVILYLCDLFWGREAIEGSIYTQLKNFIGTESAAQLQEMIQNLSISNSSSLAGIIGISMLIIGATSVFAEIQDSINTIWDIRPKKKTSGFWLFIKARLLSFGVIGSIGFILLVSLGISAILDTVGERLTSYFPDVLYYVVYITNSLLSFIIISLLFGAIFTILPDAEIKWRQVKFASFTTALLFIIGKFIISFYIANSNISSVYGSAGSFVIIIVWVYYSSVILYFGAQLAKSYAIEYAAPIQPSSFAEFIVVEEIKKENQVLEEKQ
ncbi:Ribonuclease BN [Flavobacterium sp. 9AF]|uniref:YihY/virulence factor BrkB family protein n=1 Tax=Flavobacterium sp. 9AF TaxID=2653142 RepID=UPI0012F3E2A6|nr:YihY/virulence factor BrkB family protein [Flavobacterium sp. 9AF]VXC06327.1 Ribonuclease BN [Flavobacterium sp. 9AF]